MKYETKITVINSMARMMIRVSESSDSRELYYKRDSYLLNHVLQQRMHVACMRRRSDRAEVGVHRSLPQGSITPTDPTQQSSFVDKSRNLKVDVWLYYF